MKKILFALIVSAVVVPAALAGPAVQAPSAFCKTNAATLIGTGKTYKNLGSCVTKQQTQQASNTQNAAKVCKTEQAMSDADFAVGHPGKTFDQFYGANGNGKGGTNGNGNAFGKCVSQKASAKTTGQQAAQAAAGKKCATAELKAKIGANLQYRNRGACVSALSKPAS